MSLTEKQEKMIEEILDLTDFDKIQRVMIFLNWKWANNNGGENSEIPSTYRIIKNAKGLLTRVCEEDLYTIGSGGLKAVRHTGLENGEE